MPEFDPIAEMVASVKSKYECKISECQSCEAEAMGLFKMMQSDTTVNITGNQPLNPVPTLEFKYAAFETVVDTFSLKQAKAAEKSKKFVPRLKPKPLP